MRPKDFRKLIILIALFSLFSSIISTRSSCIFINIIGVPCLTCGMTRAYSAALKLNFKAAFYYHPLFWIIPIFIYKINIKIYFYTIFILLLITWVVRMYLYFPDIEPMIFNTGSIYAIIYNKLNRFINL